SVVVFVVAVHCVIGSADAESAASDLPAEWLNAWRSPGVEFRPLQIVHGVPAQQATVEAMKRLNDAGLGGIVCNVAFDNYLRSETNWQTCVQAVKACAEVGLRVWIYDEDGYPSGAAGGLVLEGDPGLEALALAYDPSHADPFIIRASYEHTHASNNFYAARRYPNLIDKAAVAGFIKVTHDTYYRHLEPFFGTTIEAFFTDEPSLMAVSTGPLPDDVRKQVRVVDPLDPNVRPLASVPWVADLPDLYRQRYSQDLIAVRKSLFGGDTDVDRQVRRQYWALIADLLADRYYGQIQQWTRAHSVASSGHILWEEMPLHNAALEGNSLQMLGRMDIPGLDMLSSDPEAVIYTGWMTAALPASAALLNGRRLVMTEVSDFVQTMAKKGPAPLADMCATAAWQAALGVTEFTLYYGRAQRTSEEYQSYCTFVGRLNALLREAQPAPRVLLYYPIRDVWSEYKPVAGTLTVESQSQRLRGIVNSFMDLGQRMTRGQISFAVADHESLATGRVQGDTIHIGSGRFKALVLPTGVELPSAAERKVRQFEAGGGRVLRAAQSAHVDLAFAYDGAFLSPASERIVVGRFARAGREMILVVNVGSASYGGAMTARDAAKWTIADPVAGTVEPVRVSPQGQIVLSLPPRTARIFIGKE
ncbi:MAG: hypothetical protein JW955_16900, partial [Sedimentisphaerales bacterium]|nr:hypothetical protein [Sedimentisphaerales bacterium]